MVKKLMVSPKEMRRAATISLGEIAIKQYRRTLKDEIKEKTLTAADALRIWRDMCIVREFETMLEDIKKRGGYRGIAYDHKGPAHLSIGQEAAAVGEAFLLGPEVHIYGSHRSHGEIIAKGLSAIEQMAEADLRRIMEGWLGGDTLRRVHAAAVTGAFYDTLGLRPAAGRLLTRSDDAVGAPLVAVASFSYWQHELAGKPLTLEQFKGNVREVLSKQTERDTDRDFTNQVLDAIIDMSQITFPRVVLAEEIDHQLVHFKDSVAQLGLTWPKYLELTGRTEEGVRTELEPAAEKNLKRLLTMVELAKAEGVQVTREELDADIERRVQSTVQAGGKAQVARRSYNTPDARRDLETNLRLAKGMSKIIARVKGEAVSGRILTPEMVKDLETPAIPSGLITDPSTVRSEDWPKGL